MLASKVILCLQELIAKHGDLPVVCDAEAESIGPGHQHGQDSPICRFIIWTKEPRPQPRVPQKCDFEGCTIEATHMLSYRSLDLVDEDWDLAEAEFSFSCPEHRSALKADPAYTGIMPLEKDEEPPITTKQFLQQLEHIAARVARHHIRQTPGIG